MLSGCCRGVWTPASSPGLLLETCIAAMHAVTCVHCRHRRPPGLLPHLTGYRCALSPPPPPPPNEVRPGETCACSACSPAGPPQGLHIWASDHAHTGQPISRCAPFSTPSPRSPSVSHSPTPCARLRPCFPIRLPPLYLRVVSMQSASLPTHSLRLGSQPISFVRPPSILLAGSDVASPHHVLSSSALPTSLSATPLCPHLLPCRLTPLAAS